MDYLVDKEREDYKVIWNYEEISEGKQTILELQNGEQIKKFAEIDELVLFVKSIEGKVKVAGEYINVFLADGEVVWYESEHGLYDEELARDWCGIDVNDCEDEEEISCYRCGDGGCPDCDRTGFFTGFKIYD